MKLYKTMARCTRYQGINNVDYILVDGVGMWANKSDLKPVFVGSIVDFSRGRSAHVRSIRLSLLANGLYAVVIHNLFICDSYTILAAYKSVDNARSYFNVLVEQYRRSENWKEIV